MFKDSAALLRTAASPPQIFTVKHFPGLNFGPAVAFDNQLKHKFTDSKSNFQGSWIRKRRRSGANTSAKERMTSQLQKLPASCQPNDIK